MEHRHLQCWAERVEPGHVSLHRGLDHEMQVTRHSIRVGPEAYVDLLRLNDQASERNRCQRAESAGDSRISSLIKDRGISEAGGSRMRPLKNAELAELPAVVDITTAARALGLSRTYAYQLAKQDQFPC